MYVGHRKQGDRIDGLPPLLPSLYTPRRCAQTTFLHPPIQLPATIRRLDIPARSFRPYVLRALCSRFMFRSGIASPSESSPLPSVAANSRLRMRPFPV